MALQTGEILALVGMAVLLLSNIGRKRGRQGQVPKGGFGRFLAYGDYIAFGFILTGLVVMYLQK